MEATVSSSSGQAEVCRTSVLPNNHVLQPPHPLSTRYNRQLLLPQMNGLTGQIHLSQSRVLIIGLGGLGCPAALYLAAAGVGALGFVDGDVVEESNLHRQVLHTEGRVGQSKVQSAMEGVRAVNSGCRVEVYEGRVGGAEVLGILEGGLRSEGEDSSTTHQECDGSLNGSEHVGHSEGCQPGRRLRWDMILDCTDNPATRYAINDAAVLCDVPVVSGAAQRGEGMLMVLNFRWKAPDEGSTQPPHDNHIDHRTTSHAPLASTPESKTSQAVPSPTNLTSSNSATFGRGPCYRCIFPHPPDPSTVHSCSEIGVLGTAVGTIGVLMAQEALKLLVSPDATRVLKAEDAAGRRGEMLIYNAFGGLKGMFRGVGLRGRRKGCVSCGDSEDRIKREDVMKGRMDYEAFCGRVEDIKVLKKEHGERIGAEQFLEELGRDQEGKVMVVDVREEIEVELGSRFAGAVNLPFSTIVKDPERAFAGLRLLNELPKIAEKASSAPENDIGKHKEERVYFVCHRGNDSQIAAMKLMELEAASSRTERWIGDVEGGFVAIAKVDSERSR